MRRERPDTFSENRQLVTLVFSAPGDAARQRILPLFKHGEAFSIKGIASMFPAGRSTVVHHLPVLAAGARRFIRFVMMPCRNRWKN